MTIILKHVSLHNDHNQRERVKNIYNNYLWYYNKLNKVRRVRYPIMKYYESSFIFLLSPFSWEFIERTFPTNFTSSDSFFFLEKHIYLFSQSISSFFIAMPLYFSIWSNILVFLWMTWNETYGLSFSYV